MADLKQKEQELKELENQLKNLREQQARVANSEININTTTSENNISNLDRAISNITTKIDTLKVEISSLGSTDVKINVDTSGIEKATEDIRNDFQKTEESLKKPLFDTMQYVNELSRMLQSINNSAHNNGSSTNSSNIGDYFMNNGSSILPYGVTLKSDKQSSEDNDDDYDVDFGVDSAKLLEIGEDYKKAVEDFVEFLNKFKEQTGILKKSALNKADPTRMIDSNTGEVFDKFKDYIDVSTTRPDFGMENVDYVARKIAGDTRYISQKQTPESAEQHRGNVDAGIDGLGLFTKTVSERLLGYEENGEKHAGYQESMEKLNEVALKLIDSFSRLSAFIPALSDKGYAFDTFLFPENETSLFGQDIFKRLTYMTKYSGMDYEGEIEKPSQIKIQDLLGLSDLKISPADVLKSLENSGIALPEYNENSSIRNNNISKIGVDEYNADIAKIVSSVDTDTFKQDNFDELSDEEKKAATVISDFRANLATTANIIKSLSTETATKTSVIPETGVEFGTSYNQSKSRSGAVTSYNKAMSEVSSLDKELNEIDARMSEIEKMFASSNLVGLTSKDEFDGKDPVTGLNDAIVSFMDNVVRFSQSEYSKSAQKANASGEKMFDPDKYITKINEYSSRLSEMSKSDSFKVMQSSEGLKEIDTAIKNVERIKNEQKQASAKDKLGNSLITSSLKEYSLEKELVARESTSNSGLLSGTELDKNNAKIEEIKKQLESLRKTISEVNEEANKSGIPLESEVKLVDNLKNSYNQVATALGSTAKTDSIFNKLSSAKSVAEIDAIISEVEKLKHLVGDTDFSKGILGAKGYTNLINSGGYERELSSKIVNTDKLRGDDLNIAKYNNMAYEQLIRNTREAQTGFTDMFANKLNNINVDELKQGINKTKSSFEIASAKILELENTGLVNSEIISFKDKLRQVENQLDNINNGFNESSNIGELRLAFEKAKNLGITIDSINDKLAKLELDTKFKQVKNYVSDTNALRQSQGQAHMTSQEEADYYSSQLPNFAEGTREYIEILKLKNQALQKSAEEAQKAAEKEKKAHDDALKAAKDKVTGTLNAVKRLADGVNNAVNKVISIIRTAINIINKVFSTIGKFVGKIATGAKAIVSLFGSLSNRVRGTAGDSGRLNGSFNILAGTATELRSKIMLLKGAFDALFNNQMVKKAENLMASVYSLKNIAGGGVTQEVLDWANSMEYAFGISAKELIGDINELTGVLYGLGMTAEDTAVGSENLLMMSRYLAFMGAAGGDAKTVMSKLVSGMKGMTQAIDDLGLSVRDAQMNSFLKSLKAQGGEFANIATDFSSLNEEARVYVRYAALIDQFTNKYDVTNFAKALDTVTGRMQIMKQTAASLVTTIGTGLAKAISKLAIFIVPLLKTIEAAVTKIFAFFGIDVSMTTDINEGTDAVDDLNNGLDDTKDKLDKVEKSANKAKGSLQSFDRVNNVTSSSSSGSGSSSDEFDYKKLMTSMLGDLNKLAEETAQSFADNMQEKMMEALKNMREKFLQFAKDITGRLNFDLGFDWAKIKKNLGNTWKNIKKLIKSWGTFFVEIGLKIADDVNIGAIVTKLTELISKISELANAFSDVAIPVFREFYDEHLKPVFEFIGNKAIEYLDKAINKIKEWIKYWSETPDEAGANLKQSLEDLWSVAKGEKEATGPLENLVAILREVKDIAVELAPVIKELVTEFSAWTSEELLPWLVEKLGEIKTWLAENKDKVKDLLTTVAGLAWDEFKTFVDLVGKLVDFCVQHPTAVITFFSSLLALKVGSWGASTAAGLAKTVLELKALSAIIKGGGLSALFGGAGGAGGLTPTAGTLGAGGGAATAAAGTGLVTKIPGLAIMAGLGFGLKKATESTFDNSLGYDFKSIFSGEFLNVLPADEINEWADKYYAYMQKYSQETGVALESLRDDTIRAFKETLEEKGWSPEQVDLMLGQFTTQLDNHMAGKMSTWSDAINGNKAEAEAWAQALWDSNHKVEDSLSTLDSVINTTSSNYASTAEEVKYTLDDVLNGTAETYQETNTTMVSSLDNLVNDMNSSKENVKYTLDEILAGIDKSGQEMTTESTSVGEDIIRGVINGMTIMGGPLAIANRTLFGSIIDIVKTLFGIHSPSTVFADLGTNIVLGLQNGISNAWNALTSKVSSLCGNLINFITTSVSSGLSNIGNLLDNIGGAISDGWNAITGQTMASNARTVTSHAVGGSIAGGQLFIANENGGAELVGNITGASGAQVANNGMIIEAMTNGVFTGVYNALAEVNNQKSTVAGAGQNINLKIDGFGLIDSSTLSELARMLAPYQNSNNANIANVNFSI